jgi:hypothetical protein
MAKRTSKKNPHDLYNIIHAKKKVIFEYATWAVSWFLCQSIGRSLGSSAFYSSKSKTPSTYNNWTSNITGVLGATLGLLVVALSPFGNASYHINDDLVISAEPTRYNPIPINNRHISFDCKGFKQQLNIHLILFFLLHLSFHKSIWLLVSWVPCFMAMQNDQMWIPAQSGYQPFSSD